MSGEYYYYDYDGDWGEYEGRSMFWRGEENVVRLECDGFMKRPWWISIPDRMGLSQLN
jgi:hypothetical protein